MSSLSYVELLKKELERPELTFEQREKIFERIAVFESRKQMIALAKARGGRVTPLNKHVPAPVRDKIIAQHEEEVKKEREQIPMGVRVDEALKKYQSESAEPRPAEQPAASEAAQ